MGTSKEWIDRDVARVWHGFTQMAVFADNSPLIVERGEGAYLYDVEGNRYLDAISSLWVTTLGHRVPELDAALKAQADQVAHATLLGNGVRVTVELAEALAEVVPVEDPHFIFASDGAAAVEQGLKMAFQYWRNIGVEGRDTYLAFGDAYHGDTVGSMSVGGDGFAADLFDPLRFPVLRAPGFDDPDCMEKAASMVRKHRNRLAAVVVEPLVQGAAGIRTHPAERFAALQEACDDTGVLLMCDEVATGFGRTGTLFASTTCGLRPNIMSLGKGITGGYLAMSATAADRRVYDTFLGGDLSDKTLYHGHSYGGNALAAAVALEHLRLVTRSEVMDNVAARAAQLATLLEERIAPLAEVNEIRQQGLMCGVELEPSYRRGRRVCAGVVRRGVLLRPLGDVVVLMPHLTVTEDQVTTIVEVLAEAIEEESAA